MRSHLVAALVATVALATPSTALSNDSKLNARRTVGYGQVRFDGHGPEWWAARARVWRRAYERSRRAQLSDPSVAEAINLAGAIYGHGATLWRKARCETGGTFSPYARNPYSDASGLFQFLPSTFASTPFASFSIWSPYANALAAGWMHSVGRGGEWVCR